MAYLHSFYQSRFTMKSPSGRGIFPQIRSKRFSFIFGGLEVCRCVRSRLLCRLFAGISHSTLHTLHFTLHTQHYETPHSTLFTLDSTLHYTLYTCTRNTPNSTLHTAQSTLHFTLHTLDFTLYTPNSSRYPPHTHTFSHTHTLSHTLTWKHHPKGEDDMRWNEVM